MLNIWHILRKEVASFLNNLIAYIVITVFLTGIGLFVWIFGSNILDAGYAEMEDVFFFGPWFFLFLIPAITMRSFSEEVKSGTLEILTTKPVTDWQIILGKYLAAVVLVIFSLLPTLIYYVTIWQLGSPPGNIDSGPVWGAYLGLIGIGAIFAAIGIFASTLTENQIVAFILTVFLCFFFFVAFDFLAELDLFTSLNHYIASIGIFEHYRSISKGVIDTRDAIYYLSFIVIALLLAKMVLTAKMKKNKSAGILQLGIVSVIIIFINLIGNNYFARLDLTAEKRYTLSDASKEILENLNYLTFAKVYLAGEMPTEYKKLQEEIRTLMIQMKAWGGDEFEFDFVDISDDTQLINQFQKMGYEPFYVQTQESGTQMTQQFIMPYAVISQRDYQVVIDLAKGAIYRGQSGPEIDVQRAMEDMEYKFMSTIYNMNREAGKVVGILRGHGEYGPAFYQTLIQEMGQFYTVLPVDSLAFGRAISPSVNVLMVIQPDTAFTEREKYELDQYVMRGGKIIWMMDQQMINFDIGEKQSTLTNLRDLNLDDLFMRYGFKINYDLVQDMQSDFIELAFSGPYGPQMRNVPWYFNPIVNQFPDHPVNRNLDAVLYRFPSSIDTIPRKGIKLEPIVMSSPRSRTLEGTQFIDINQYVQRMPPENVFTAGQQILTLGVSGRFTSLYAGRTAPVDSLAPAPPSAQFLWTNVDTTVPKMIVISDGEFPTGQLYQGKVYNPPYDNQSLVMNCVDYLSGDEVMTRIRAKHVQLRRLDRFAYEGKETLIQAVNLVLPVAFVVIFGIIRNMLRKRRNKALKTAA